MKNSNIPIFILVAFVIILIIYIKEYNTSKYTHLPGHKRVALCIAGAVGIKTGNYQAGKLDYVNFRAIERCIRTHIIEANPGVEFEIFIHTWNPDLEQDLKRLYDPKKILCEDNNIYRNEIKSKISGVNTDEHQFRQISHLLSIKKSLTMALDDPTEFDCFIRLRPDVLLWKDMKLDEYVTARHAYVNGHSTPEHGEGNGDFHHILNKNDAIVMSSLYDRCSPCVATMHKIIQTLFKEATGRNFIPDSIIPGKHQEVLRKLYRLSVKTGYLDDFKLREYGLTTEELMTYRGF
tara:strand:+ start:9309 stop:10184 length:876 start_codon:yes stop_codon:yes gene_type:complete